MFFCDVLAYLCCYSSDFIHLVPINNNIIVWLHD